MPAAADPVQIPGPKGVLEGEAVAVSDATHAVVIIPGSGPVDRDGNGPPVGLNSDSYRLLAEGLAEHGVASIRIDKRGFTAVRRRSKTPTTSPSAIMPRMCAAGWRRRGRWLLASGSPVIPRVGLSR